MTAAVFTFAYARPGGGLTHPWLITQVDAIVEGTPYPPFPVPPPAPPHPPHPPKPPVPPVIVQPPAVPSPVGGSVKIGLNSIAPFANTEDVTEVPHPDGKGLVALKTGAGTYKSLTPQGSWQPDAASAGSWERFFPYGGLYLAYREDSGLTFSIERQTVTLPYQG